MTAVERLLATARNEIGYLEKKSASSLDSKTVNAGYNNYTKYARDLDETIIYNGKKNGYAWCDIFCDWCFIKTFGFDKGLEITCQPVRGAGAGCTYSAQYYKKQNRFYKSNPQPGDQIFFTKDGGKNFYHTGIVEKVENGRVYTIEGNTSSAAGVVENGGAVRDKSYSINSSSIGGYGRPKYEIINDNNIKGEFIMDDNTFKDFYLRMRKSLQDNDCSDYSEEARKWAIKIGLVVGSGTTTASGEPNYMWEDVLTREQFITVLYRFAKEYGFLENE